MINPILSRRLAKISFELKRLLSEKDYKSLENEVSKAQSFLDISKPFRKLIVLIESEKL